MCILREIMSGVIEDANWIYKDKNYLRDQILSMNFNAEFLILTSTFVYISIDKGRAWWFLLM